MNKTLKKLKKNLKKSDCANRNSVIPIGIMDFRSKIHKSDQQFFFLSDRNGQFPIEKRTIPIGNKAILIGIVKFF